jgi:hypothetical protein
MREPSGPFPVRRSVWRLRAKCHNELAKPRRGEAQRRILELLEASTSGSFSVRRSLWRLRMTQSEVSS